MDGGQCRAEKLRVAAKHWPSLTLMTYRLLSAIQSPHDRLLSERGQQFLRRLVKDRVARFRGDFGQRLENEAPLVHLRMRNGEARLRDRTVAIQDDVDIDLSWAPPFAPDSSHGGFNLQQGAEQLARSLISLKDGDTIQEPGLLLHGHRLGFIDG